MLNFLHDPSLKDTV